MSTRQVIVVVGAGVIGVTTAHALLDEGHEVVLLEAAPAAARGTSQANGGFVSAGFCAPWAMPGLQRQILSALVKRDAPIRWRPDGSWSQLRWLRDLFAHCKAPIFADHRQRMVRLALLSQAQLRKTLDRTALALDFQASGVLQILRQRPEQQMLDQRLEALQALGINACWYESDQVRALEPFLSPTVSLAGGLYVQDDVHGDCEQFVQGLLAWNIQRGLKFEPGVRIDALEIDRSAKHLRAVRCGTRRWDAQAFVFATGVQSTALFRPALKLPVVPVKGYSVTLTVETNQGATGAIIDEASKLAIARMGGRIRLAGGAELVGHDLKVDEQRCDQLIGQYEALYGPVSRSQASFWSGLRPMTPDSTPIIGATPVRGLYLNVGHGTYGWTLACGSAQLLADSLAGRPAALDLADYTLDRSAHQGTRASQARPSLT
jgi:D-amino-acid dehydrogenase